jgi:hypothetical protein
MFCFTAPAATTLHDVQMLTDKDTMCKLGDSIINDICQLIG